MISLDNVFILNHLNSSAFKSSLGSLVNNTKSEIHGIYDFAVSGGATGDIQLLDRNGKGVVLPNKAVITNVIIDVITGVTSGGSATLALKSNTAADLLGATAKASFASVGLVAGIPVGTAATAVKMTADRKLFLTVAVAALTAGKLNVLVEYHQSL